MLARVFNHSNPDFVFPKPMSDAPNITRLLSAVADGDKTALDELVPVVYAELRRMAQRYFARENPGHTLQATALVNEVYLKLAADRTTDWRNRAHFFGVAAQMMRHILVDHARGRQVAKRGGGKEKLELDEALVVSNEPSAIVTALDDALKTLAETDARKARIVELRFFGGLTAEETAEVLGVAAVTVNREWRLAKAWLQRELSNS